MTKNTRYLNSRKIFLLWIIKNLSDRILKLDSKILGILIPRSEFWGFTVRWQQRFKKECGNQEDENILDAVRNGNIECDKQNQSEDYINDIDELDLSSDEDLTEFRWFFDWFTSPKK